MKSSGVEEGDVTPFSEKGERSRSFVRLETPGEAFKILGACATVDVMIGGTKMLRIDDDRSSGSPRPSPVPLMSCWSEVLSRCGCPQRSENFT